MAGELSRHERFLRRVDSLALSTLPIPDGLLAAAPRHHDGAMVALIPDNPEELALEGEDALPADDLHITLCYLGKAKELDNFERSKVLRVTQEVCDTVGHSFSSRADGVMVMGSNDEGVPATALLIQAEEIVSLYENLAAALDYESKYPSFIPHMTTGYGVPVEEAQALLGRPVRFNSVVVKFGDDRHIVPLSAAAMVAAPRSVNIIDRVIDSLGRLWDEALHPRGDDGRFIKKNGAVSGKLSVPTRDRKNIKTVEAHRASVIGFHTFDNEVWVLAEIKNPDGSTTQGFAKADEVHAVAPVKARLDALYPVTEDDAFVQSSTERARQLDLILAKITKDYGADNDTEGARSFLDSIGLWEKDIAYIEGGDDPEFLGGIRRIDHELSADELDEQADIIDDARQVKELRDRVHGLSEDVHSVPQQRLLTSDGPETDTVEAIRSGADPLSLNEPNLLAAMDESGRFTQPTQIGATGISPIGWRVDEDDQTGYTVGLAGTGQRTTGRAYFVKESVIGADMGNTDIAREVLTSLIAEQIQEAVGDDDERPIPIPRSVFGDNPVWDGKQLDDTNPYDTVTHQPAHVVSSHADYAVPSDWTKTTITDEETALYNDIRDLDDAGKADATLGYYEDYGEIYGNDIAKLVLWDFLTLNGDRNPGNAVLAASPDNSEGRVLPIDHGFAFDNDPFDEDLPDGVEEGIGGLFDWFMGYHFTKAWMAYVHGGLDLYTNVTPASLQQILRDFIDVYSQIDAEDIVGRFSAMPNVTDGQIELANNALAGVIERIEWMQNNMEHILRQLTTRRS